MRSLAPAELMEVDNGFVEKCFANLDKEDRDEVPGLSRIIGD